MNKNYTFDDFSNDLDNGYKIIFTYVKNRYVLYKVNDNCYMKELLEQHSKNSVPPKAMITLKAIYEEFPFMEDLEYKQEI